MQTKTNETLKFYNNQPCVVIREITEGFSEIKLHPHYTDGIDGSQWCTACMVGSSVYVVSHTCDKYDQVIDAINETATGMIVQVENRLLHDEPIEKRAYDGILKEIEEGKAVLKQAQDEVSRCKDVIRASRKTHKTTEEWIEAGSGRLNEINEKINAASNELENLTSATAGAKSSAAKIDLGGMTVSMSADDLKELILASVKLRHLEKGGVDNWEWYSESLPSHDDLNIEVLSEIRSLSIESI